MEFYALFLSLGSLADVGHSINVGYEVKWKDPWEPFFIAPRASADYDERFKQVCTVQR